MYVTDRQAEVERGRPEEPGEKLMRATEGLCGSELTMGTVTTGWMKCKVRGKIKKGEGCQQPSIYT